MNDFELLAFISKEDTEKLLMQKDLTRMLNNLASRGLIDIWEGKIKITEKGIILKKMENIFYRKVLPAKRPWRNFQGNHSGGILFTFICVLHYYAP